MVIQIDILVVLGQNPGALKEMYQYKCGSLTPRSLEDSGVFHVPQEKAGHTKPASY